MDSVLVLTLGRYSQNFLRQILKIFVTLTWILEPIKNKKLGILYFILQVTSTFNGIHMLKSYTFSL
jgi:hypothetical protein